jgi:hypothetical protein
MKFGIYKMWWIYLIYKPLQAYDESLCSTQLVGITEQMVDTGLITFSLQDVLLFATLRKLLAIQCKQCLSHVRHTLWSSDTVVSYCALSICHASSWSVPGIQFWVADLDWCRNRDLQSGTLTHKTCSLGTWGWVILLRVEVKVT